jgi:hypothetical protein
VAPVPPQDYAKIAPAALRFLAKIPDRVADIRSKIVSLSAFPICYVLSARTTPGTRGNHNGTSGVGPDGFHSTFDRRGFRPLVRPIGNGATHR